MTRGNRTKWLLVFVVGVAAGAAGIAFAHVPRNDDLTAKLRRLTESMKDVAAGLEKVDRRIRRIEQRRKGDTFSRTDLRNDDDLTAKLRKLTDSMRDVTSRLKGIDRRIRRIEQGRQGDVLSRGDLGAIHRTVMQAIQRCLVVGPRQMDLRPIVSTIECPEF